MIRVFLNSGVEGLFAARKPDPVSVEERAGAFETSRELVRPIEIEGRRLNLIA